MLQRSTVWPSAKESRASFAIEHEQQHADRVRRFAAAMEQCCGRQEDPLSDAAPDELQAQILGPRATRHGVRRSPVFVGEVDGCTEVLADVVQVTIEQEMREEAGHLRGLRLARERVKGVIEGPDMDIDRIIRAVRENGGKVSNKLVGEFPALADESLATAGAEAIAGATPGTVD